MTRCRRVKRVLALQHFVASSLFLGTLTASSGTNVFVCCVRLCVVLKTILQKKEHARI